MEKSDLSPWAVLLRTTLGSGYIPRLFLIRIQYRILANSSNFQSRKNLYAYNWIHQDSIFFKSISESIVWSHKLLDVDILLVPHHSCPHLSGYKELRSIGVDSLVCHGEHARPGQVEEDVILNNYLSCFRMKFSSAKYRPPLKLDLLEIKTIKYHSYFHIYFEVPLRLSVSPPWTMNPGTILRTDPHPRVGPGGAVRATEEEEEAGLTEDDHFVVIVRSRTCESMFVYSPSQENPCTASWNYYTSPEPGQNVQCLAIRMLAIADQVCP